MIVNLIDNVMSMNCFFNNMFFKSRFDPNPKFVVYLSAKEIKKEKHV